VSISNPIFLFFYLDKHLKILHHFMNNMEAINVGIIGVGNCASSLVQGRYFYKDVNTSDFVPGLITTNFGGYLPKHINFVTAFDIDDRKINQDASKAVFAQPNCTTIFQKDIPNMNCTVEPGYLIDSFAQHLEDYPESQRIKPRNNVDRTESSAKDRIIQTLKNKKVEVLVNFLPVGSEKNAYFYADCALEANCAFVNAVPVFISKTWGNRFLEKGLPILGDDIKSQVGATIIHRMLTKLLEDRGHVIQNTYQLNVGGNTDFLNMLDKSRLTSKKVSKTQSVTSQMSQKISKDNIHIGPSDFVPFLKDNKVCFIRLNATHFGDIPMEIELRLSVEDSPNSAGVITDAIRAAKLALNHKLAGPIIEPSSYLFKSPVKQFDDSAANQLMKKFIDKYGNQTTYHTVTRTPDPQNLTLQ
jgi:myo-inositol-1-phosphate synthase